MADGRCVLALRHGRCYCTGFAAFLPIRSFRPMSVTKDDVRRIARLARIAEEVGYESEAAFSRAFKRITGISPSQWRGIPGKQASIRPAPSTMRASLDGPMASQSGQISRDGPPGPT